MLRRGSAGVEPASARSVGELAGGHRNLRGQLRQPPLVGPERLSEAMNDNGLTHCKKIVATWGSVLPDLQFFAYVHFKSSPTFPTEDELDRIYDRKASIVLV